MAPAGAKKSLIIQRINVLVDSRSTFLCCPLICICAAAVFVIVLGTLAISLMFARTDSTEFGILDVNDRFFREFEELSEKNKYGPISIEILTQYYQLIGPSRILDVLEKDPFCHDRGHNLGRVVFNSCKNLGDSISICGNRCTGACYHGALMQYFQDTKTNSAKGNNFTDLDIRPYFSALCSSVKQQAPFVTFFTFDSWRKDRKPDSAEVIGETYGIGDCYHSLGHAVMYMSEYDVERAMVNCDSLHQRLGAYYCATGAYHEYFLAHKKPSDAPLLYPCDSNNYFPAACYRICMSPYYQGYFYNVTYDEQAATCRAMTDVNQRRGCFHGFGSNIWIEDLLAERWSIASLCALATDRVEERMCIDGIAGIIDTFYENDVKHRLCSSVSDSELFAACMAADGMEGMNRDPDIYYVAGPIGNSTVRGNTTSLPPT